MFAQWGEIVRAFARGGLDGTVLVDDLSPPTDFASSFEFVSSGLLLGEEEHYVAYRYTANSRVDHTIKGLFGAHESLHLADFARPAYCVAFPSNRGILATASPSNSRHSEMHRTSQA